MSFDPLKIISSKVVLLPAENIDTDRIIPARFLKSVSSDGFGKNLFHDWRYRPDGTPDPDFVLNTPDGQGQILLTGKNFGCGSSREHAAWALYQYGFRVIISSGFADIFRTNALNNGLLPLEVTVSQLTDLMKIYQANPEQIWTVNIDNQTLVTDKADVVIPFDINSFRKQCLLTGSDVIDYLAGLKPRIEDYEASHRLQQIQS
jgi:3-isopropylmalate/(R)-2-methylmalate dehydratase small subunit